MDSGNRSFGKLLRGGVDGTKKEENGEGCWRGRDFLWKSILCIYRTPLGVQKRIRIPRYSRLIIAQFFDSLRFITRSDRSKL